MKTKRFVALLLSVLLMASLFSSVVAENMVENKPITLQVLMHGIQQMSGIQDDAVSNWVREKTGITLDVMSTTGMNIDAELNAMIASDSLPDIIIGLTPEQRL